MKVESAAPPPAHLTPERLAKFVESVSPRADPKSVLLLHQILSANRKLIHILEKELEASGLSWAKFRMLIDLRRHEEHGDDQGLQPSELSDTQGISRNTVSALIASLEEDGLISRELHSTDRRKFVIRLTAKGRRVVSSRLASEFELVTRCFAAFSDSERETLHDYLQRLNANLAELAKPSPSQHGAPHP